KKVGFFQTAPSDQSTNLDIGTNMGFIKNRIGLTLHYFIRNDENLGYYLATPPSIGLPPFSRNGVRLSTKGLELGMKVTPIEKKNFFWDIALNMSHYKGIIKSMGKLGGKLDWNHMIWEEGRAVNTFYMPRSAGVNPVNGDELYAYTAANGATMTTN